MPQKDHEAAEMEHTQEVGLVELPAGNEAAKIMEPSEQTFDLPSATVAAQFSAVLGLPANPIALVRRNHADAVLPPQAVIEAVTVIGQVADQALRFGSRETLREGVFDELRFMRRSAGDAAGDRKAMAVCDRHDFTAFSAASRADSRAPFFAELKLASMNVSLKSILPRSRRSSASASSKRVRVPSRCHC